MTDGSDRARRDPRQALKWVAASADRLRPGPPGVVVLIYHRVGGDSGLELDLAPDRFAAQMAWLAEHGLVVPLDRALEELAEPGRTGPRRVVLTFDDGTRDFVEHTVPVLVAHGLPATLYLATAFVDEQVPLPYGAPPTSWGALREAVATGLVTVGSHTHHHALLDRLAPDEIARELDTSVDLIERELGTHPEHFAYPKALAPSADAAAAVRARFRSAALAGTHANRFGATDPLRLARSPIQESDGMRWFEAKAGGGMALEDLLRRTVNRVRQRDAVS